MSRRQGAVAGGAGRSLAVGSENGNITRYLCVSFDGCRIAKIVEVWPGEVWVAAFRRRGKRYVAVVERVGMWFETLAVRTRWTWVQATRLARALAERHDVCVGWETYDVCRVEEEGRLAEAIMELSRGL